MREFPQRLRCIIDRKPQDLGSLSAVFLLKGYQVRYSLLAGAAPGSEKIHDEHLATIGGQ